MSYDTTNNLINFANRALTLSEEYGFLRGKLAAKDETILSLQKTIKEQEELIDRLATDTHGGNGSKPGGF